MKQQEVKRQKYLWLILFGMLSASLAFTRQVTLARNYNDPNGPKFLGQFSDAPFRTNNEITVVSYNIKYAQQIATASREFDEVEPLANADIVLLQEMDEVGTERLAKAHGYNFVYFPAAVHPIYGRNFGNAILSKWPIRDAQKLILPHKSLTRSMTRQATKAIVTIGETDVLVYSIHAETAVSVPRYRWNQYKTIIDDIEAQADYVIVGGDFNTITSGEVNELGTKFANVGLVRASNGTGHTVTKLGVEMSMDHIFTKGFSVETAGKVSEATASDHLPIWVDLALE